MIDLQTVTGPHQGQPVLTAGQPLNSAKAAMVMIHGRGASAQDILTLVPELSNPDFTYLAPQAAGHTWYPYGFMSPLNQNEPHLSSALATVGALVDYLTQAGFSTESIILLGFSQGACLSAEFMARNARRYGGLAGLSGGLIGPDGTPRDYQGSLAETPVFLGCSDVDFHIPKERVRHTAEVLQALGADVTMRLYPNMGHTINRDEIDSVRKLMAQTIG